MPEHEGKRRWDAAGLDDLVDGMNGLEFMLRFTLSHPDLSSTIVGTASPRHLQENLAIAAKGPLPADVYAEARRRLTAAAADDPQTAAYLTSAQVRAEARQRSGKTEPPSTGA
jgi:aryl-alcohol dehydrogenase-like predicted oxidoreductase